jgi:excisionase family DNA binding protein
LKANLRDGALGLDKAAEFTGLKRSYLYELIEQGELPSIKIGRRRLVPRRALVDLLDRHVVRQEVAAHA